MHICFYRPPYSKKLEDAINYEYKIFSLQIDAKDFPPKKTMYINKWHFFNGSDYYLGLEGRYIIDAHTEYIILKRYRIRVNIY